MEQDKKEKDKEKSGRKATVLATLALALGIGGNELISRWPSTQQTVSSENAQALIFPRSWLEDLPGNGHLDDQTLVKLAEDSARKEGAKGLVFVYSQKQANELQTSNDALELDASANLNPPQPEPVTASKIRIILDVLDALKNPTPENPPPNMRLYAIDNDACVVSSADELFSQPLRLDPADEVTADQNVTPPTGAINHVQQVTPNSLSTALSPSAG